MKPSIFHNPFLELEFKIISCLYLNALGTLAAEWWELNSVLAVARLIRTRSQGSLSSRYKNTYGRRTTTHLGERYVDNNV